MAAEVVLVSTTGGIAALGDAGTTRGAAPASSTVEIDVWSNRDVRIGASGSSDARRVSASPENAREKSAPLMRLLSLSPSEPALLTDTADSEAAVTAAAQVSPIAAIGRIRSPGSSLGLNVNVLKGSRNPDRG
jgi:hypothetical protein